MQRLEIKLNEETPQRIETYLSEEPVDLERIKDWEIHVVHERIFVNHCL